MRSSKRGKNTSVSVEGITPWGLWLFANNVEYFVDFDLYPFFRDQTLRHIQNVALIHDDHLYWPDLDVDLEIDVLQNPEKYPLLSKEKVKKTLAKGRNDRSTAHP